MAEAEESKSNPKWEGKAMVEVEGVSAEQAWPLLEDFCNVHKLIPIDTCYREEGVPGHPGLIRYCAATTKGPDADAADETTTINTINWVKEKLLTIDPIQRCLSYEIVENNMGFKSYVATLKVFPINNMGCRIEMGFVSDPVQGWRFQDLNSYIESSLQSMAKNIHELACSVAA